MNIVLAKHAGFCFGVRRALRLALDLEQQGHRPIYTLGPLIHNPQEIARLAGLGIERRDRIDDCLGGKTLIRTHGISRSEEERAHALGVDLVDATCPYVKVPRRQILEFSQQRRTVLLLGDHGHPEIQAMLSYVTGAVFVVAGPDELPALDPATPLGLLAQTTQPRERFEQLVEAARHRYQDVLAVNTICEDTQQRQGEARALAGRVDLVIVIGGRNSANTCKLAQICRNVRPETLHIETADELREISFAGVGSVGLVSGASTPDWIIEETKAWLSANAIKRL